MLVKVNSIDIIKKKVKVTQLDIDDYGSVIPLKELEPLDQQTNLFLRSLYHLYTKTLKK
jgi:hypothetical protein